MMGNKSNARHVLYPDVGGVKVEIFTQGRVALKLCLVEITVSNCFEKSVICVFDIWIHETLQDSELG